MTTNQCAECGARYDTEADSCASRFEELLALDHSRREPWGSRHGQAFATFALQHPSRYPASLDAAWGALYRLCCLDQPLAHVMQVFRGRVQSSCVIPPRPDRPIGRPAITIADLTDFEAATYPSRLDAWSRATLVSWGVAVAERTEQWKSS